MVPEVHRRTPRGELGLPPAVADRPEGVLPRELQGPLGRLDYLSRLEGGEGDLRVRRDAEPSTGRPFATVEGARTRNRDKVDARGSNNVA